MKKLVCGKGFNDRSRPVKVDGKDVKEYKLWQDMLRRCFSDKYQTRYPTYKGCSVSDNFLNYTYFYDWCQEQIGFGKVDEKGRSWCLDKDVLFVGNKTYSETTCVFVPNEINVFFNDCSNTRGEYHLGVCFNKASGKFQARCGVNGVRRSLGYFNTAQEAFTAYKPFKEAICKQIALKWQHEVDERLFNAMMKWSVKDNDKVIMNTLPFDISRCKGFKNNPLCQQCRRTEQGCLYRQSYLIVEKEPKQHCELQIKK